MVHLPRDYKNLYGINTETKLKSTLLFKLLLLFFFLGFTTRKAEQPLQGMELQEKEAQKD